MVDHVLAVDDPDLLFLVLEFLDRDLLQAARFLPRSLELHKDDLTADDNQTVRDTCISRAGQFPADAS